MDLKGPAVQRLRSRIERVMRGDGAPFRTPLSAALFLLSLSYGAGVRLRTTLYKNGVLGRARLSRPVISVGNLTVGGTGKTPTAVYLAEKLRDRGARPALVSRGYGGAAEGRGGVVSGGGRIYMDARSAGDEPLLMARRLPEVPVLIGRDRHRMGLIALERFGAGAVILDDAFQHLRLERNIDLVLMDARRPLGNGRLFPMGPLREPPSALRRAGAVMLTRCDRAKDLGLGAAERLRRILHPRIPILRSSHAPRLVAVVPRGEARGAMSGSRAERDVSGDWISGRRVFLFSGIGENADFRRTVRGMGGRVAGALAFPDHHDYTDPELRAVIRRATDLGAEAILTTEKDHVRIMGRGIAWPLDLGVVGVEIRLHQGEAALDRLLGGLWETGGSGPN